MVFGGVVTPVKVTRLRLINYLNLFVFQGFKEVFMDKKRCLVIALTVVVALGSFGCGWRRGKDVDDFPPAHLDAGWPGSADFRFDDDPLAQRFGYTQTLDVHFENVLFGFDSSQIASGEQSKIEDVANYMRRNPNVKAIIEGHTCDIGSREYNMALGERRALAARAYLVQLGIEPARIQTLSYGEENPLHFGTSEAERRLNRRAAFNMVQ